MITHCGISSFCLIFRHFADNVEYEIEGFLHKNRDTVMEEQLNILRASNNELLSDLFLENKQKKPSAPSAAAGGGKKQNKKTVRFYTALLKFLEYTYKFHCTNRLGPNLPSL